MTNKETMNIKAVAVIVTVVTFLASVSLFLTWPRSNGNEFEPSNADGTLNLLEPETSGSMSVEEAISKRRSVRSFTDEPLSMKDVSQLLWAAQGITDTNRNYRAAPSAGATYPLEVYIVLGSHSVTDLAEGVYQYDPHSHQLEHVLTTDLRSNLADAALGQRSIRDAPISIIITAVYERTTGRYGERGVRYVHMEAGHVAQNVYLQAETLGLGLVVIGAFHDDDVQDLLQLSTDEHPLYIIPIGHPR